MKIYFVTLLLAFTMHAMSQTAKLPADSLNKVTIAIRKEYSRINSLKNLVCKEEYIEGESTEGAAVKKCYCNNQLVKATFEWFGETGRKTRDFYCKDGKVLFYYAVSEHYDKPIYVDKGNVKVSRTIKSRYYFTNDKLIYWLKGSLPQPLADYPAEERDILSIVKKHLQ